MDTDFLLVLGVVICLLALPKAISAYSEERSPRFATAMILIGGAMFVSALILHPAGYVLGDIPEAVLRVIARISAFLRN